MEWEKQTKREICRKVLGRTLEAAKSWIERWWAETSEGTISVQMASWIFHMRVTILGEAEVLQRLFCHSPLNRGSYSSGTKRHTLYAKVILSTENFVLSAHKILVSSNSFQHKVWNVLIWHTQSTCLAPVVASLIPSTYTHLAPETLSCL